MKGVMKKRRASEGVGQREEETLSKRKRKCAFYYTHGLSRHGYFSLSPSPSILLYRVFILMCTCACFNVIIGLCFEPLLARVTER